MSILSNAGFQAEGINYSFLARTQEPGSIHTNDSMLPVISLETHEEPCAASRECPEEIKDQFLIRIILIIGIKLKHKSGVNKHPEMFVEIEFPSCPGLKKNEFFIERFPLLILEVCQSGPAVPWPQI